MRTMKESAMIFDRAGLREIDRRAVEEFGIPILVLMENAGRAVAEAVKAERSSGRIALVCGPGNNGGDGLVAARHLHNAGLHVMVLLAAQRGKFSAAAATQLAIVDAMKLPVEEITAGHAELRDWIVDGTLSDLLVDALFGTGLSRPVDGLAREIIEALHKSGRKIFSVDIPSGIDCDTGLPLGVAVKAAETISFCGMKKGFTAAHAHTGKVTVADIGAPRELLQQCAIPAPRP